MATTWAPEGCTRDKDCTRNAESSDHHSRLVLAISQLLQALQASGLNLVNTQDLDAEVVAALDHEVHHLPHVTHSHECHVAVNLGVLGTLHVLAVDLEDAVELPQSTLVGGASCGEGCVNMDGAYRGGANMYDSRCH